MTKIAIFASGTGTNAANIIQYFSSPPLYPEKNEERRASPAASLRRTQGVRIALIVTNKEDAGVLKIAHQNNIPTLLLKKEKFFKDGYTEELKKEGIGFIVLAGFLWKLPEPLIEAYRHKIINIHPALLPKYGGKGMYGMNVHAAVIKNKEKESGITIHYVDEHYDNGDVILQVKCPVLENDTPETLAMRIHALEYANYPVVIEELVNKIV